jgi:hypothetical protein
MDINSREILEQLKKMSQEDPEGFCKLMMASINHNVEAVLEDGASAKIRVKALTKLMRYFESIEDYENCQVLKDLIDQINGSK